MKSSFIRSCLLLASVTATSALAAPAERQSTVWQRELVNLTVYNADTSLVHDRRRLHLDAGINRIAWRDVSAQMDPTTALVDDVTSPDDVNVIEQNFDFDLLGPDALLQRYLGQEVVVVHDPRFAGERETRETARILSTNGGIVLQYRNRIETALRGHIAYPVSSKNFRDRPTLVLEIDSRRAGSQSIDLSYLTTGLSWHADYVGVLGADEKTMSLVGLVTLSNTSGVAYDNARLQLVAGNVNVTPRAAAGSLRTIAHVTSDTYSVPQFGEQNYFEYHLYTLQRPTTVLNNQTKQISLLSAHGVPIRKTLELRGSSDYYRSAEPDLGDRLPVQVYVSFENHGGELGIPLPAGTVRLYKNDAGGLSQFVGSDQIGHTPRNETVRLNLGQSFDVTARKKQTSFDNLGFCSADSSYEIVVSNAKPKAQDVLVVEAIPGSWQILAETAPHVKSSASSANWTLRVPADGRTRLTYTARSSWC
jgi:hypothetical protein